MEIILGIKVGKIEFLTSQHEIEINPGIRFYFLYDKLVTHPNVTFDGVLPMKIKDEVILKDWIYKIVIPQN